MSTPVEHVRDVILRDGRTLRLRPPLAGDEDAVLALFHGLSDESAYRRFHGFPSLGAELVTPLLDPDWLRARRTHRHVRRREGTSTSSRSRTTSAPRSLRSRGRVHRRGRATGIRRGTRLLEQLAERARSTPASSRSSPTSWARIGRCSGSSRTPASLLAREIDQGDVEVRLSIGPPGSTRARVDERDHVAVVASLQPFFSPRTVAVVGASSRRGSIGGELFRNVLEAGFDGVVYPVNLKGSPSPACARTRRSPRFLTRSTSR